MRCVNRETERQQTSFIHSGEMLLNLQHIPNFEQKLLVTVS